MTRYLYLHSKPGSGVWLKDGPCPPVFGDDTVTGFIHKHSQPGGLLTKRPVRILGTTENAELVVALHDRGFDRGLQLGTPAVCDSSASRLSPDQALFRAQYVAGPASLGGWHWVAPIDLLTYRLIVTQQLDVDRRNLYKRHPVHLLTSFVCTSHEQHVACAELLSTIVDPRWYIDPVHPDRLQRLHQYLGLTPAVFLESVVGPGGAGGNTGRAATARKAWSSGVRFPTVGPPEPEALLWRIMCSKPDRVAGFLLATKTFVNMVRAIWMDAITGQHQQYFDPTAFFRSAEEVTAWQEHCRLYLAGKPV